MDYKKAYLEERIKALNIEMGALQLRFQILQHEIVQAQKELNEYTAELEKDEQVKCRNL